MTYDYICEACGHAWEAQQSISAEPLKDCPHCGAPKAKRQISLGGGFILKGGGWYSDLYSSSDAKTKKSEGDTSPAATEKTAADGKSGGETAPTGKTPAGDGKGATQSKSTASTTPTKTTSGPAKAE